MRPETEKKVQKIKKVSAFFRIICTGLLSLAALLGVASVVCVIFGVGGINFGLNSPIFWTGGLTLGLRLLLGVVTAVTFTALFKCVYHLQHLFGLYSRGEIFTRESVGHLRSFGVSCVLWGAMTFIWSISLALAVHPTRNVPGHGDSTVIGVVIILIAWFMDMAVDLREENELTI